MSILNQKPRTIKIMVTVKCPFDHVVMGLMDPAHGPFVHSCWWWPRKKLSEKVKTFEPIYNGFRFSSTSTKHDGPYCFLGNDTINTVIEFVLPAIRTEKIDAGEKWFISRTVIVPISEDVTKIDVSLSWFCMPWIPIEYIVYLLALHFIKQDIRILEAQAKGLQYGDSIMLVGDADAQAKWYLHLKNINQKQINSHPLTGPVTLRWKS